MIYTKYSTAWQDWQIFDGDDVIAHADTKKTADALVSSLTQPPAPSPLTALERAVVEAAVAWCRDWPKGSITLPSQQPIYQAVAALLAAEANAAAPG